MGIQDKILYSHPPYYRKWYRMTYMFAPIGTYDTDFNHEDYITEPDECLKCLKCDEKLIVDDNNKIICNKCNK